MPYRLMGAIRNFSQHEDLPISGSGMGTRPDRIDGTLENASRAYSITPKWR
jgi:hypothetical protein